MPGLRRAVGEGEGARQSGACRGAGIPVNPDRDYLRWGWGSEGSASEEEEISEVTRKGQKPEANLGALL